MSNPMFKEGIMENVISDSKPMTVQGSINKTFLFLGIVVLFAAVSWDMLAKGFTDKAMLLSGASLVIGFILALITSFKPHLAKITGTLYAVCEGLLIGSISYAYEHFYNGIVVQAVGITLLVMFVMLFLFTTKIIQATDRFKRVVITATLAIGIYYLICIIASFLGHPVKIFDGGLVGIGISLFICVIAALNFIIDFDFIERGSQEMRPGYYEWYGAFGLLVTLVWLYFEILRLLAQLNSRR